MLDVALLILATAIVCLALPRLVAWRENAQRAALLREATEWRREFDREHSAVEMPEWTRRAA